MKIQCIKTGPFGVNTYIVIVDQKNCFVVDCASCSFCNDEKSVSSFLASSNLNPLAFVCTHGHFDHVAGLKNLKICWKDVPVLINPKDSLWIGPSSSEKQGRILESMGFEEFIPSVSNLPEAEGFLEEGKSLAQSIKECNKKIADDKLYSLLEDWQIIESPGHTEGSVCIYNRKENIFLSGDTVFYHSWGRTDFEGGNESKMQESLKKIYGNVEKTALVFPGHDRYGFRIEENF